MRPEPSYDDHLAQQEHEYHLSRQPEEVECGVCGEKWEDSDNDPLLYSEFYGEGACQKCFDRGAIQQAVFATLDALATAARPNWDVQQQFISLDDCVNATKEAIKDYLDP